MRQLHHNDPRRSAWSALLPALALGLVLTVAARTLLAGEGPLALGGTGGDTVGSLPMMSGPGGSQSEPDAPISQVGPERPAFALTGLESEVLAAIVDAFPTGPDGRFARIDLPDGRVRYEFHGRMSVLLNRSRMLLGTVRAQTVVGSTFLGGVAQVSVGGVPRATEALAIGIKDLRLQTLDNMGVLVQSLRWHAVSLQNAHRVLVIKSAGNQIRIDQRD